MLKVDILPQSPTGSVTDVIPERPKISAPTIIYKNIRYPNLAEASAYQSILEKMDRDLRTNSIYNESPVASIGGHFSPRLKKLKKRQSTLGTTLTSAKGFILNTSNNNNSLVNELTDNGGNNNSSNRSNNNSNSKYLPSPPQSPTSPQSPTEFSYVHLAKELAKTKETLHEQQKITFELIQMLTKKVALDDNQKIEMNKLLERTFKNMLPK